MAAPMDFSKADAGGYDDAFEDEEEDEAKQKRQDLAQKAARPQPQRVASKSFFRAEVDKEGRRNYWEWRGLTEYEKHVQLINTYYLYSKEAKLPLRDTSRDKRDIDVIREHHQFLWEEDEDAQGWEKRLAKRYYDKLFKEFCISDLSQYRETKRLALRWRTEQEVIDGKGQFVCGEKRCTESNTLTSWEVNFCYKERDTKKNALVKLKLCPGCSSKLNSHHKHRQARRSSSKKDPLRGVDEDGRISKKKGKDKRDRRMDTGEEGTSKEEDKAEEMDSESLWKGPVKVEEKDEEEKMNDFLDSLFC